MNPTLETTKVQERKMNMEFQDDTNKDCAAIVTWTYISEPTQVYTFVTSIHINVINTVDGSPRMPEYSIIEEAYNFIASQYRFVNFECKGAVTVQTTKDTETIAIHVPAGYERLFENIIGKLETMIADQSVNVANTQLLRDTHPDSIQDGFTNATKNAAFYIACAKQIENLA